MANTPTRRRQRVGAAVGDETTKRTNGPPAKEEERGEENRYNKVVSLCSGKSQGGAWGKSAQAPAQCKRHREKVTGGTLVE